MDPVTARPQRAHGAARLSVKPFGVTQPVTRINRLYQDGCAKIRFPESFDGAMEAVLINSSGGLTGGDRIDWTFDAAEHTRLTLTTQACEKIYKATQDVARVVTRLSVENDARLDWLPQETILFDRAALSRQLDVELTGNAEFLAAEAVLLGRKAMGESVSTGLFRDRWRIRRDGQLIHAEDLVLAGDIAGQMRNNASLNGHAAFATVLYAGADCEALLPTARALLAATNGGISHWSVGTGQKLVARLVAADGFSLRKILIPLLSHLRKNAPVPKVWTL